MNREIEERLQEIENRLMNTTPGPWKGEHETNIIGKDRFGICSCGSYFNSKMDPVELHNRQKANKNFIMNAPEDIRWMLKFIDQLIEKTEELEIEEGE